MSSNKNTVMKSVKSTKAPKVTQTTVARCKVTAEIQGMLKHGPLGVEGAALQGHFLTNVLSAFCTVSERRPEQLGANGLRAGTSTGYGL